MALLRERASDLRERMDDPACDAELLRNTYAHFELVNRLVAGWGALLDRYLGPRLHPGLRILDIGCGGGDLVRRIAVWAARRGTSVELLGVDPDARGLDFARSMPLPDGVEFRRASSADLLAAGERFDVVFSNHVLHHLQEEELAPFLEETGALADGLALHNDLRRHPVAYGVFALGAPLFRRSYIIPDGLRSIRRAYSPAELRPRLPPGWRVEAARPFRNLVVLER